MLKGYCRDRMARKPRYVLYPDDRLYEPGTWVTRAMTRFSSSGIHALPEVSGDDIDQVEKLPRVKDIAFISLDDYTTVVATYVDGEYRSKIRAVQRFTQSRVEELQKEIQKLHDETEKKIAGITADFTASFETRLLDAAGRELPSED